MSAQVPADQRRIIVTSVSPQSIASLARRYRLTMRQCQQKVSGYLRSLGVDRIYDLSAASALALAESQREFVDRARRNDPGSLPMLASACPGMTSSLIQSIRSLPFCNCSNVCGCRMDLLRGEDPRFLGPSLHKYYEIPAADSGCSHQKVFIES